MSKIKVNEIEAATGSTVTIPTGQTFTVTDGIPATNLSGTIADARLPTVPVAKGGTGLTSLGSAGQAVKVNDAGNALEFGAVAGGKILQVVQTVYKNTLDITDNNGDTNPETPRLIPNLEVAITPSATNSKILLMARILGNTGNNTFGSIYKHTSSQSSSSAGTTASGTDLADPYSPGGRSPTLGPDMEKRGTNAAMNEANMIFIDSPNTTSVIYYVPIFRVWSGNSFQLNHSMADSTNAGWVGRGTSSFIAMEIGA
ncbi:hypothetical protein [uncultured Mediterranean phage uvMED]|nr:hypothetical protein [uncultured Mediterranean phage uvMED]